MQEQKDVGGKRSLFRSRRLFMVPQAKLTEEQAANLAELSRRFPKTGRACQIVASLDEFYRSATPKEAEGAFARLCSWMRRCRLEPMKEAALTLMRHRDKILAYFTDRLTSAIYEGINSLVQAAKRKARGIPHAAGLRRDDLPHRRESSGSRSRTRSRTERRGHGILLQSAPWRGGHHPRQWRKSVFH